jgi:hypothetical protein
MAEELSGQADQLQSTMSFFKVRNEKRRLLTGGTGDGSGSGSGSVERAVKAGSATPRTATGAATAPATAAPRGQTTGITIPMGEGGNAHGDHQDDEFEEY